MTQYYCNPINGNYRYQFIRNPLDGSITLNREAADPSLVRFKGKYYLFASMTLDVWISDDLINWESQKLPENLPLYGYAPDVCAVGDYLYFCASNNFGASDYYRTKDAVNGPYEKIESTFGFHDPHLFSDDDGKLYFYWGCSDSAPIWGAELDPITMKPKDKERPLISSNPYVKGFERMGDDNSTLPLDKETTERHLTEMMKAAGMKKEDTPEEMIKMATSTIRNAPYIEGPWMNKYQGKYYLQYASPATQLNVYSDSVYESDSPLGPFQLAKNNPFSYKPGGFMQGAGHGSTLQDIHGNIWHAATMRISVQHQFERRVGIWPAGFDSDGELFCNQRYGDWPQPVKAGTIDPWEAPEWYLLSYKKKISASSYLDGKEPHQAVDENARTWWKARSNASDEWLQLDLGESMAIHALQINFADDVILTDTPPTLNDMTITRYIDDRNWVTRWILEASEDGIDYIVLKDNSKAKTDLPHDFLTWPEGIHARFMRITFKELPFGQNACVSGFRVFGRGKGERPQIPEFEAIRSGDCDMDIEIKANGSAGYNILWGHKADKLYHSYLTYEPNKRIGALVVGTEYFVRVDSFNENGITQGIIKKL